MGTRIHTHIEFILSQFFIHHRSCLEHQFFHFCSVGTQRNPSLTWGGQYNRVTEYQQPLIDDDGGIVETGSYEVHLIDPVMPSSRYLIRAFVEDSQGCHGESGNYTVVGE